MKNRIKVLRAERDWTQAQLAEALAVSRQTVNAIETGKYDPSLPLAFRIAQVFGLRIEDVFRPERANADGDGQSAAPATAAPRPAPNPAGRPGR